MDEFAMFKCVLYDHDQIVEFNKTAPSGKCRSTTLAYDLFVSTDKGETWMKVATTDGIKLTNSKSAMTKLRVSLPVFPPFGRLEMGELHV